MTDSDEDMIKHIEKIIKQYGWMVESQKLAGISVCDASGSEYYRRITLEIRTQKKDRRDNA